MTSEIVSIEMRIDPNEKQQRPMTVALHMRYTFKGPAGDEATSDAYGLSVDYQDKAGNQAMSQALKMVLLQMFLTPSDQPDADGLTPHETSTNRPPKKEAARAERQERVSAGESSDGTQDSPAPVGPTLVEQAAAAEPPPVLIDLKDIDTMTPGKIESELKAMLGTTAEAASHGTMKELHARLVHLVVLASRTMGPSDALVMPADAVDKAIAKKWGDDTTRAALKKDDWVWLVRNMWAFAQRQMGAES